MAPVTLRSQTQKQPTSTTMSDSTESAHANSFKAVNWLFFDPANDLSEIQPMPIEGCELDNPVCSFGWAAELKRHFRFRASRVHFWKPKTTLLMEAIEEGWIDTVKDFRAIVKLCQPPTTVKNVFGERWNSNHVHLFITADESEEDEESETAVESRDTVPELPLQIMNRRHDEAIRAYRPAPSTAARSREFASLQRKSNTVIYNGSFARDEEGRPKIITVAPPIQIFHPVFQEFLDGNEDPNFKPDEKTVKSVLRLMHLSSEIHPTEDDALSQLRGLLADLLGGYMAQEISDGSCNPDGLISRRQQGASIPLLLFEYKRSLGEGGCDPSVQAAYSLLRFLYKPQLSGLLRVYCCPSFLLAGAGPHLSIYGAIHTDKFIVQHLVDVHLGEATMYEDLRAYRVAKIFFSLRRAREHLDNYYRDIVIPTPVAVPKANCTPEKTARPCFFPHPTEFTPGPNVKPTRFKFVNVPDADPANVTFFAEDNSQSPVRGLVVKFVNRYGVEAHETLAERGMAPRLLYYGTVDGKNDLRASKNKGTFEHGLYLGPLRMVIMDRIKCEGRDRWPDDAREQVQNAIGLLHSQNLVFGDLRPPNVLFSEKKVFLIDFDWAGQEGVARYPHGLSRYVEWAANAEDLEGQLIKRCHDDMMLDILFPQIQGLATNTN